MDSLNLPNRPNLPDFLAEHLPIEWVSVLKVRGVVLLRQILDPAMLSAYLPHFQAAFTAEDRRYISGQMPPEIYQKLYRYGHAEPNQIADYYAWIGSLLQAPGMKSVLQALYGSTAYLLVNNSFPRRQDPAQPEFAIPFHQDQEFTGPFRTGLNLWLPLTPVGQAYPSLELCLDGPQQPLFQLRDSEPSRQKRLQELNLNRWQIEMQPGDLLIFTGFTLHRSWISSAMTQVRYSTEIRLIADSEKDFTQAPLLAQNLS